MMEVRIRGVGLVGPGLADWSSGQALLREPTQWVSAPTVLTPPPLLPPAERRRAGSIVKLSLGVAEQACTAAGAAAGELATVFSASSGDPANCHALCEALATAERLVSPTRFTNSVHNGSAGYWHIANHSRAPSTSLCAFDASFGAGLLEAVVQCVGLQRAVLLVACDVPYLEPLNGVRPMPDAFGLALLLDVAGTAAGRRLRLAIRGDAAAPSRCEHPGLEAFRRGIPAARGLPLLQALAGAAAATLQFDGQDMLGMTVQLDAA